MKPCWRRRHWAGRDGGLRPFGWQSSVGSAQREYEKAWDYIERQLTLIGLIGVQTVVQTGQNTGQFESLDGRIWEWNVQIAESGIPLLYDVLIGVEWEGPAVWAGGVPDADDGPDCFGGCRTDGSRRRCCAGRW